MKKIYFAPETEIVNVQTESLMAISGNDVLRDTLGDETEATSGNLSRGSLWDDED